MTTGLYPQHQGANKKWKELPNCTMSARQRTTAGQKWQWWLSPGFLGWYISFSHSWLGLCPLVPMTRRAQLTCGRPSLPLHSWGWEWACWMSFWHGTMHKRPRSLPIPISASGPSPFPGEPVTIFYSIILIRMHFWSAMKINKENLDHYPVGTTVGFGPLFCMRTTKV